MFLKMKRRPILFAVAAAACLFCFTLAQAKKPDKPGGGGGGGGTAAYRITDLGGFTGGDHVQSVARAINNPDADGFVQVVGESRRPDGDTHGIAWDVDDFGDLFGHADLGAPPGVIDTSATAVNDSGLIVGRINRAGATDENGDYIFPAWFVSPGKTLKELPTFGGLVSVAYGVNNTGHVVGFATTPEKESRGALWHVDDTGTVTGPLDLGTFFPRDINDLKVMAGEQGDVAAIAWFNDEDLEVVPLGLLAGDHIWSQATAINTACDVVGYSVEGGCRHAFLWTSGGGMIPLGDFSGGGGCSQAFDINDLGQVVGTATKSNAGQQAFLWENGVLINLNDAIPSDPPWNLAYAYGINEAGQIVGYGRIGKRRANEVHGFLLTLQP